MDRPYPEISNNISHSYISLMLLEIDLLTLNFGVGLNLPPFINSICVVKWVDFALMFIKRHDTYM